MQRLDPEAVPLLDILKAIPTPSSCLHGRYFCADKADNNVAYDVRVSSIPQGCSPQQIQHRIHELTAVAPQAAQREGSGLLLSIEDAYVVDTGASGSSVIVVCEPALRSLADVSSEEPISPNDFRGALAAAKRFATHAAHFPWHGNLGPHAILQSGKGDWRVGDFALVIKGGVTHTSRRPTEATNALFKAFLDILETKNTIETANPKTVSLLKAETHTAFGKKQQQPARRSSTGNTIISTSRNASRNPSRNSSRSGSPMPMMTSIITTAKQQQSVAKTPAAGPSAGIADIRSRGSSTSGATAASDGQPGISETISEDEQLRPAPVAADLPPSEWPQAAPPVEPEPNDGDTHELDSLSVSIGSDVSIDDNVKRLMVESAATEQRHAREVEELERLVKVNVVVVATKPAGGAPPPSQPAHREAHQSNANSADAGERIVWVSPVRHVVRSDQGPSERPRAQALSSSGSTQQSSRTISLTSDIRPDSTAAATSSRGPPANPPRPPRPPTREVRAEYAAAVQRHRTHLVESQERRLAQRQRDLATTAKPGEEKSCCIAM